jgi:hypothetical protein
MVRDFYPGTLTAGTWTGPEFVWQKISGQDTYYVKVVAKDFQSGETATTAAVFTQGNTAGLNVDILGDGFPVLDQNFQLFWYFDTFQHDSGAPQLNINRPAVPGETCASNAPGCPTLFLAGTAGATTLANDWIHQNSIYYDAANEDMILSSRDHGLPLQGGLQ